MQFLPADDPLTRDALLSALPRKYAGLPTSVMRAEHLVALALKTGRGKDYERVAKFMDMEGLDLEKLKQLAQEHKLGERVSKFLIRYPEHATEFADDLTP